MKKVGLISLGCPKNLVDSEVMLGLLKNAGYEIVNDPNSADVLIVNTCSFIEDAKKESIDAIFEMAGIKRSSGGNKKLVITGCLPQRYKDDLIKQIPEADIFIGTGDYPRIVEILRSHETTGKRNEITRPEYIHSAKTPRIVSSAPHSVYIKIAEGCLHSCSYCIIPKIRGRYRSRTISDVIAEARRLLKNGAKELVLIAQDTSSYGIDLKDGSNLTKLLRRLSKLEGYFCIRIMYAYPSSVTDELIEEIAVNKKVCKYIDIPIQHISEKILRGMNRKESPTFVRALLAKLRKRIPEISLRTSVICGFPGESERDFKELLAFVKEGHFNNLGAFAYSREDGTAASKMRRQVSRSVAERRQKEILSVQKRVSLKFNKMMVGKELRVIIDSFDGKNLVGRTAGQARDIDGLTFIKASNKNGAKKVGEFCNVKISRATVYDLFA